MVLSVKGRELETCSWLSTVVQRFKAQIHRQTGYNILERATCGNPLILKVVSTFFPGDTLMLSIGNQRFVYFGRKLFTGSQS
jgi:hypothetical protein